MVAVNFVVEWGKLWTIFPDVLTAKVILEQILKNTRSKLLKRRFTKNELFKIRNLIPIQWLIKEQLGIASKHSEGYFRFLCPLCNQFQTGIKVEKNLARCFRCETNFNPIDMVINVKGFEFIETVEYLQPFLPDTSDSGSDKLEQHSEMLSKKDSG